MGAFGRCFLFNLYGLFFIRIKLFKRLGFNNMMKLRNIRLSVLPESPLTNKYPLASNGYSMEKILYASGVKNIPYSPWLVYDFIVGWQDSTINEIDVYSYVENSYNHTGRQLGNTQFINEKINDISKKKVALINKKVFGYDLDVDPLKYKGKVVKKSDLNGLHDGKVIDCPIAAEDFDADYVYNVCVNNINENNEAVDFRVIYINGVVDVFYEKTRPLDSRFDTHQSISKVRETKSEFSSSEIEKIELFCKQLGADYGEMDVLRDKATGDLYIVDFAKTPFGPLYGFTKRERLKAVEEVTVAFIKNLLLKIKD